MRLKSNLVATAFLCFYFGIFVFIMDMISTSIECNGDLPSYFTHKEYLFFVFISCSTISLPCNVFGFALLMISILSDCKCKNAANNDGDKNADGKGKNAANNDKGIPPKNMYLGYIGMTLCCGSTILFLSFHFQNIIIAWSIVPFYAGRIFIHYGIILFICFLALKYVFKYSFILFQNQCKITTCNRALILLILIVTSVVVVGTIITVAIFIIYIPISNSIEDTAVGITTVYHGAVLLIGGLIAYNIGGHYFGGSFSMNNVLNRAMQEIGNNPFDESDNKEWRYESEEMRMSKIVQYVLKQYPESVNNSPKEEADRNGGIHSPQVEQYSESSNNSPKEVVEEADGNGDTHSSSDLEIQPQELPLIIH